MIIAYSEKRNFRPVVVTAADPSLLTDALWIDLLFPTQEEISLVESCSEVKIPSRAAAQGIEFSSRFYDENESLFMTTEVLAKSEVIAPSSDAVTFILTPRSLLTIRHIEPQSFFLFVSKLVNLSTHKHHPKDLLIAFLDSTVDHLADLLEMVGLKLDNYSQTIFRPQAPNSIQRLDYKTLLQETGAYGDLNTKVRESLISFHRLIAFFNQNYATKLEPHAQSDLAMLLKDINSLNDYSNFISNKVSFLLSATLGLVNIEQNNTIKLFSVASVIFLPPTLIASMYGMNFKWIPELQWSFGYFYALLFMLLSALLPYWFFKQKNWL